MSEYLQEVLIDYPKGLSRRELCSALVLETIAILTLGACGQRAIGQPKGKPSSQQGSYAYEDIGPIPHPNFIINFEKFLDPGYLPPLTEALFAAKSVTLQERSDAIRFNTFGITTTEPRGVKTRVGTALMVDQEGYFLTSAQMVTELAEGKIGQPLLRPPKIFNPKTGEGFLVTSMIVDPKRNIALSFAPFGSEKKPSPSLQLRRDLKKGENLLVLGLGFDQTGKRIGRSYVSGSLNSLEPERTGNLLDQLRLSGANPVPMGQGAAIIDQEGRVVGVRSLPIKTGFFLPQLKDTSFTTLDFFADIGSKRLHIYSSPININEDSFEFGTVP